MLNNLNRGLGLCDVYPFVLSPAVIAKLRFVDDVVGRAKLGGRDQIGTPPPMRSLSELSRSMAR